MGYVYRAKAPDVNNPRLPDDWPPDWPLSIDIFPPDWPIDLPDGVTMSVNAPDFAYDDSCAITSTVLEDGSNSDILEYHLVKITAKIGSTTIQLKEDAGDAFADYVTAQIEDRGSGVYGISLSVYLDLDESDVDSVVTFTCNVVTVSSLIATDTATVEDGAVKTATVASTANLTLSGEQTIDGIAVVAGNTVLAKNQTTAANRKRYLVSTGAWTAIDQPDACVILKGTVNSGRVYVLSSTNTYTVAPGVFA